MGVSPTEGPCSTTEVLRDEPYVFLEIDLEEVRLNVGECYIAKGNFNVGYTLTNTSQTTAFNVDLSVGDTQIPLSATITPQMPLTSIKPDNSKEGIVYMATGNLSPGTYTISLNLTFEDYYGKEFQTSESFNIIVVSDAYQLYEQGELYLLSCSYQNAISSFEEAKALYDEVGYQELSNKCYNKIELVNAIILFEQGQDYYFSGDLENAVAAYEAAKTHYDNADDCTGVSLCQDAINAIGQMDSTSPGDTEQTGGGGLTMLNMSLIIIIIVLVGMLVIVRMGKR